MLCHILKFPLNPSGRIKEGERKKPRLSDLVGIGEDHLGPELRQLPRELRTALHGAGLDGRWCLRGRGKQPPWPVCTCVCARAQARGFAYSQMLLLAHAFEKKIFSLERYLRKMLRVPPPRPPPWDGFPELGSWVEGRLFMIVFFYVLNSLSMSICYPLK